MLRWSLACEHDHAPTCKWAAVSSSDLCGRLEAGGTVAVGSFFPLLCPLQTSYMNAALYHIRLCRHGGCSSLLVFETAPMQSGLSVTVSGLEKVKGKIFQQSERGTLVYHVVRSLVGWATDTSCKWMLPPVMHVVIKKTNSSLPRWTRPCGDGRLLVVAWC